MTDEFAQALHRFLAENHHRAGAMIGPDPGVRFNYRFWRFFKSAFSFILWGDDICYMQTQGYWILANWRLSTQNGDRYHQLAIQSSDHVIAAQRLDGAWDFPNPEWRGRVTTVEGIWASLGMLESYKRTGDAKYLNSVLKWDEFFKSNIGFQQFGDELAVNYFAGETESRVPNNSALALRYLGTFDAIVGRMENKKYSKGLINFLKRFQRPNGELPYEVDNRRMQHFQCYQYHAFILLDLLDYHRVTGDASVLPILHGIVGFLQHGVSASGDAYYQCGIEHRTVYYHSAAVAAAFREYTRLFRNSISPPTVERLTSLTCRVQNNLLSKQRVDGSLPHSRGDYRLLADNRSYPRYLSMILFHSLLSQSETVPTGQDVLVTNTGKQMV